MRAHIIEQESSIKMGGKVLVVGASGFIGLSVSQKLIDDGYQVHGVARKRPDLNFSDFTQSRSSDITSLEENAYSAVIFSAGKLRPNSKVNSIIDDVFPEAMEVLRFAELCAAAGVEKFIMISSGGTIYGEGGGSKKVEGDSLQPQSPYGFMHLMVDKGLSQISSLTQMKTVCMRVANVYGPGQNIVDGQGLIPAIRNCVLNNADFNIRGDGTSVRDYIFIDDVTEALRLAIDADDLPLALNIGSSDGASVNQVLSLFENQIEQSINIKHSPAVGTEIKEIVLDNTLARNSLGWTPQISLEKGLQIFLRHSDLTRKE